MSQLSSVTTPFRNLSDTHSGPNKNCPASSRNRCPAGSGTGVRLHPGIGVRVVPEYAFTLPIARMVGPDGSVVCVDVQAKMLDALRRRAAKEEVAGTICTRVCDPTSLGVGDLAGEVDFVLAFAVVHEVSEVPRLLAKAKRTAVVHLQEVINER